MAASDPSRGREGRLLRIVHGGAAGPPLSEFIWAEDVGALRGPGDLAASFGAFEPGTGCHCRAVLHPTSGHLLCLREKPLEADGEGSSILWAGAVVATQVLAGAVQPPTSRPEHPVVSAVRVALAGGAVLEVGAGHALPCAFAVDSGHAAVATEHPAKVDATRAALAGLLADTGHGPPQVMGLAWGTGAEETVLAAAPPVGLVLACDVVYSRHALPELQATLLALMCGGQRSPSTPPTVLVVSDPDCVPGVEQLLGRLAKGLAQHSASVGFRLSRHTWGEHACMLLCQPASGAATGGTGECS